MTDERPAIPACLDLAAAIPISYTKSVENEKQRVIARLAQLSVIDPTVNED